MPVDFITPRLSPTARAAGQVSTAGAEATKRLARAAQQTANNFTEFWEKEAAQQGELLLAEIQEEWGRTYNERAKQAGRGFSKSIMADFDEFKEKRLSEYREQAAASGQRNVPERNREDLNLALDKYRLRLETKSMQREAAAIAAAKARAVARARRAKLNALISDPGLLQEYLETSKSPKERSDYVRTALGMQVREDPKGVMDQVMGGQWDADLSPSQKMSFIKLADSGIARQEREEAVQLRAAQGAFEAELNEEIAYAEANGAPPVDSAFDETDIADMYRDDPARGAEVSDGYKQAIEFAETINRVSMQSPEMVQLDVERLQRKVQEPGNTPDDVKRLNTYLTAVSERNNQIRDDAAAYVQGKSDGTRAIYEAIPEADPEMVPVLSENYVRGLEASYDRLGVPAELRTILPDEDAAAQVAQFNAMGSDVAAAALNEYASNWGAAAPRVLAQLDKAGLAPEYTVAMRHADNPGLQQEIVNLATVSRADLTTGLPTISVKDAGVALTEGLQEYRQTFEFAGGGDAQISMNKQYDVADKLTLDLIRRGAEPDEAAERVIKQMFPETPVTGNNERYILPSNLSTTAIGQGIDELMSEEALRGNILPIDDPRFPDFADLDVTISQASRSGIWVNNSDGDGLQLMMSFDGYLIQVLRPDETPYNFTFQEIEAAGNVGLTRRRTNPRTGRGAPSR